MTLISISFIACGNSGSSSTTESNNTTEPMEEDLFEKINIDVNCTSPDTVTDYITLKSGDQIIKDDEGTKVSILNDENSVKKICLNSGKAHIVRALEQ